MIAVDVETWSSRRPLTRSNVGLVTLDHHGLLLPNCCSRSRRAFVSPVAFEKGRRCVPVSWHAVRSRNEACCVMASSGLDGTESVSVVSPNLFFFFLVVLGSI